jgi:hypothetical protein
MSANLHPEFRVAKAAHDMSKINNPTNTELHATTLDALAICADKVIGDAGGTIHAAEELLFLRGIQKRYLEMLAKEDAKKEKAREYAKARKTAKANSTE